jgi:diaminopimelate decarboxylase
MAGFDRDSAGKARLGAVSLHQILAHPEVTTPAYVYDLDAIAETARRAVAAYGNAPGFIAYAVKANSAGSIVRTLVAEGTGADVVSGGELSVALGATVPPERIVMSGVAKTDAEIDLAIASGIFAIQLESVEEIERVVARARAMSQPARVALRINPSVEIDSHAHVATGHDDAKFGIPCDDLSTAWQRIDRESAWVDAVGISAHVGSMLMETGPYLTAARVVCDVARQRLVAGGRLSYLDFGGGFGIDYGQGGAPPAERFVQVALQLLAEQGLAHLGLVVEPGRSLVGPFGALVANVVGTKQSATRRWLMIDAGMNDLIRPALYGALHRIESLDAQPVEPSWRVAGPVCESSDDFGQHRLGDPAPRTVVIRDAGAYGYSMASEYNGRSLPCEVFLRAGAIAKVVPSLGASRWVSRRLES